MMWHDDIANIPTGWIICDGANDTPDLRDKFVLGAGDGVESGGTGGSATATPSAHTGHTVTQPTTHSALSTHQHGTSLAGGGAGAQPAAALGPYGTSGTRVYTKGAGNTNNGTYSIALNEAVAAGTPNAHSGTAVDAHSAHSTADSRPPFYLIIYIMKT